MKLKPALIVFTPPALAVAAVAVFNPAALTWPVDVAAAVAIGVFCAFAMRLFDRSE